MRKVDRAWRRWLEDQELIVPDPVQSSKEEEPEDNSGQGASTPDSPMDSAPQDSRSADRADADEDQPSGAAEGADQTEAKVDQYPEEEEQSSSEDGCPASANSEVADQDSGTEENECSESADLEAANEDQPLQKAEGADQDSSTDQNDSSSSGLQDSEVADTEDQEDTTDQYGDQEPDDQPGSEDDEPSERNTEEVVSLDQVIERHRRRRLGIEFARIVAKVAEDLAGEPIEGDDEWDVDALMRRRFDRRPLPSCRRSREKTSIILILDTSGSCEPQAEFYASIAQIAAELQDVEIYAAPNGALEKRYVPGKGWMWLLDDGSHGSWNFRGRVILFFGDFDGGDYPVLASLHNKVYWFSCEDRYDDMTEHDWCSFSLADFRGHYYQCMNEFDFLKLAKKVR